VTIVSLARYWRKRDWNDQEIAEFQRVRETLREAGFALVTERGLTDEGDPWYVFIREGSDEVIAHFARIDGQVVADSSALEAPLYGRELRAVLEQTFRQYALLPVQGGSGKTLLLHPAALLTAFVATAFLQLEHGEQKLALGAADTLGPGHDRSGAAGARDAGDVGDTGESIRTDDGLKALLSRLPGLFGGGPAPGNAPARAVTVNDGVTVSETSTAHSVMLTTLVAALGALQTVDVAAAEPDGADVDRTGADVSRVPIAYASELGGEANGSAGADGGHARPQGLDPLLLTGLRDDAAGDGDDSGTDVGGSLGADDPDTEATPTVPLDLARGADRVPITFAADAVTSAHPEAAENGSGTPADSHAVLAALNPDSLDGEGSGGSAPDPSNILDPDEHPERANHPAPSGSDADISPHLDTLLFDGDKRDNPALTATFDYLDTARDAAQTVAPDPDTVLSQLGRAFNHGEAEPLAFAIIESGRVPYLGFQFASDVVFLKERALAETDISMDGPDHTIDLADGGKVKLLGVVTLADHADGIDST
jgi:hypothetical protein